MVPLFITGAAQRPEVRLLQRAAYVDFADADSDRRAQTFSFHRGRAVQHEWDGDCLPDRSQPFEIKGHGAPAVQVDLADVHRQGIDTRFLDETASRLRVRQPLLRGLFRQFATDTDQGRQLAFNGDALRVRLLHHFAHSADALRKSEVVRRVHYQLKVQTDRLQHPVE